MVGWHHWLKGREFEQALGVGDGQGSLVSWSQWLLKKSDITEWLNGTDFSWSQLHSGQWPQIPQRLDWRSTWCMMVILQGSYSKISSVQFSCSVVSDSATQWIAACQVSLSINNSWSSSKLMSIELVMPSSHLILYRPFSLLPPIPPSITVFFNESTLHMRWPKYWSFNFSIIPSKEHPGLISFRMDWLDLLADQGTLKS